MHPTETDGVTVTEARQSDAELVRRTRAGSTAALGALYERHADAVYTTAWRILGDGARAEDVRQDIFVALPEALARYDERGSFPAWLHTVAVRMALMVRRSEARVEARPPDDLAALPAAFTTLPDTEGRITVARAVATLPDSIRVVFMLRETEGYSHREIGELLGISAAASALRLHRAWKLLRKAIRS